MLQTVPHLFDMILKDLLNYKCVTHTLTHTRTVCVTNQAEAKQRRAVMAPHS